MSDNKPYKVERVGDGHHPVVIIDDFHPEVLYLRGMAARSNYGSLSPFYPGLQAKADPRHLMPVDAILSDIFRNVFGVMTGVSVVQCSFSIVTTPDHALTPIQRLPHVDTTDPGRIALLHYLSGEETGGTAFYRHRASGAEILTAETFDDYRKTLQAEGLPKAGYMRGSDDRFEQIGEVKAKRNRAVLYRSQLLHSGQIPKALTFSDNPENGRLTLNTFFQAK